MNGTYEEVWQLQSTGEEAEEGSRGHFGPVICAGFGDGSSDGSYCRMMT